MKVKTKLFVLPMIAIAIAATAFFGFANYSTPETVSATTDHIVYFYNLGWSEVYVHYADGSATAATEWPGVPMTNIGEGWFSANVGDCTTCVFNNNNHGEQTFDVTVGKQTTFCVPTNWSEGKLSYWFKDFDHENDPTQYYIVGSHTSWGISSANSMTKLSSSGHDKAALFNYSFTAGTEFKVYKGYGLDVTAINSTYLGTTYCGSVESNSNITIGADGTYAVFVTDGDRAIAVQQGADLAISSGKYKRGTSHVVIAAAFQIEALVSNDGSYIIGYKDGEDHDDNVYYSGLYLKTGEDTYSDRITADSLFGVTGGELIVFELPKAAGTYQLYIKYNGTKIATRDVTVTL